MLTGVIYDVSTYKIPNRVPITGLIIGVLLNLVAKGPLIILESLAGIFIPIAILFFLHRLKFLGAGDIKLLAMIGSYLGFDIIYVILYSFIFGGIISILRILFNFIHKNNTSRYIHFTIAIFISYVYVVLMEVIH